MGFCLKDAKFFPVLLPIFQKASFEAKLGVKSFMLGVPISLKQIALQLITVAEINRFLHGKQFRYFFGYFSALTFTWIRYY